MIEILKNILKKTNCAVLGNGAEIKIFDKRLVYPEEYIQIRKENVLYIVAEIHRDEKKIILSTDNVNKACTIAAVISRRLFGEDINRNEAHFIRKYAEERNEEAIVDFMTDKGLKDYFAIDREVINRISLIKNENMADVKYAGEYIAKGVSLSRSYVILNNYCEKLRAIYSFYENELKMYINDITFSDIAKLYIWGTI